MTENKKQRKKTTISKTEFPEVTAFAALSLEVITSVH